VVDGQVLASATAMGLTELPQSLVVIGRGSAGTEQAQLFAHPGDACAPLGSFVLSAHAARPVWARR